MARSEIAERPPLTVALLATPDSTASTLFGLYDLLLGARRDWQQLLHRADVASPFLPLIVSRDGHSLRVYNDIPCPPSCQSGRRTAYRRGDRQQPGGQPLGAAR